MTMAENERIGFLNFTICVIGGYRKTYGARIEEKYTI